MYWRGGPDPVYDKKRYPVLDSDEIDSLSKTEISENHTL